MKRRSMEPVNLNDDHAQELDEMFPILTIIDPSHCRVYIDDVIMQK